MDDYFRQRRSTGVKDAHEYESNEHYLIEMFDGFHSLASYQYFLVVWTLKGQDEKLWRVAVLRRENKQPAYDIYADIPGAFKTSRIAIDFGYDLAMDALEPSSSNDMFEYQELSMIQHRMQQAIDKKIDSYANK